MAYLPLANILHYKLRSALSALGIAVGICMLITLSGLSRGSLYEVADRWEAIDADLILYPRGWGDNITTLSGIGLADRQAAQVRQEHADVVAQVVPVFFWQVKFAGQDQMTAGVDADDMGLLCRHRALVAGRPFRGGSAAWGEFLKGLEQRRTAGLTPAQKEAFVLDVTEADLEAGGWLEIVIDERLAKAGKFHLGDTVTAANHRWTIVGIVPAGVSSRVFLPRQTAQFLFNSGDTSRSTMAMVKLKPGVDLPAAAKKIRHSGVDAVPLSQYRAMLTQKFGMMFKYVDAVNVIALVIAFLFVMVTLYMMVLQRTREIAILKSGGASGFFILRQVVAESMLLTATGLAAGVAMSFAAAWGIGTFAPLLTVTITGQWIAIAGGAALAGALASALYPAWRAMRIDMVEALSLE